MGRQGFLTTFKPFRQSWRPPSNQPAKVSPISRKTTDVVFSTNTSSKTSPVPSSPTTTAANLNAFQSTNDENFAPDCSVHYSLIFPSQSLENETQSTANTTGIMSSMSKSNRVKNPGAKDNRKRVHFDFDPDVNFGRGGNMPLLRDRERRSSSSFDSDVEVRVQQQDRLQSSKPHDGSSPPHASNVEYIEENHNQYIARRFNRTRIEFYLDLLCPPDEIDDEDPFDDPVPLEQMHNPPAAVSLPYLPNERPETNSKNCSNRPGTASSGGENHSKLTKSLEGFSLEAAEFTHSKAKILEASNGALTDDLKQDGMNFSDRLDAIIRAGTKSKIPATISIFNFNNQIDEEITLDDLSEIGDRDSPNNKIDEVDGDMMMIPQSDTYDTTNSPTGIVEFDLAALQVRNPKMLARLTSPGNITSINHIASTKALQTSQIDQKEQKSRHYYQPMSYSKIGIQNSRTPTNNKKEESQAKIEHLRSKLERIASVSSSHKCPSIRSISSPKTYDSKNIVKIKSRLRQIESEYNQLRICIVKNN